MICDRKNDREIAKNIATDRFNIQFFFFLKRQCKLVLRHMEEKHTILQIRSQEHRYRIIEQSNFLTYKIILIR